jgi:hypothetical protein
MTLGTFHTPPRNQGQIVLVSYTQIDGIVIRKTYDQSDCSTRYHTSPARYDDLGEYWNGAPPNRRWKSATSQDIDRMLAEV